MKAFLGLILIVIATSASAGVVTTDVPASPDRARTYLIYLHGRIIENSGPRPEDPRFGVYDYPAILDALSSKGAVVISAQRPPNTDVNAYAGVVVAQIERLINHGVSPGKIAVVGFSKGGAIAIRVSSFLRRPQVRFVLLAACGATINQPQLRLTGHVLSVREESDTIADGSCKPLADHAEHPSEFQEIQISTGRSHGAFYTPLPQWVNPVLDWIHGRG